jgi:hypothetical protein
MTIHPARLLEIGILPVVNAAPASQALCQFERRSHIAQRQMCNTFWQASQLSKQREQEGIALTHTFRMTTFPCRHPHNLLYRQFTALIRHPVPLHVAGPPDFPPQRTTLHVPPVVVINLAAPFAVHLELHVFGYLHLKPHPSPAKVSGRSW